MNRLDALEAQSIFILREAFAQLRKVALLWSLGKDSNVMIWLARKAFFGRVLSLHACGYRPQVSEMYAFRDHYSKEWGLDLLREECPPIESTDPTLPPAARSAARKTEGLRLALAKHGFDGVIAGIRRDEEPTRAKERFLLAPRHRRRLERARAAPEFWDQYNTALTPGAHLRIHPILHWTELDIWAYTQREGIPVIPLYFSKDGMRYRSLGDKDITSPVPPPPPRWTRSWRNCHHQDLGTFGPGHGP